MHLARSHRPGRCARRSAALLVLVFGALAWVSPPAARADETPEYKRIYTLDLAWEKPVQLRVGKEPEIERFWYVVFTITNNDAVDHRLFVSVSAKSDKGVTYRPIEHPEALRVVRNRLGLHEGESLATASSLTIDHPAQERPPRFPTKLQMPVIRAGQTIRAVAIFKGLHPEANHITITWQGLTNDVQFLPTGQPHERKVIERLFHVEYYRGGDEFYPNEEWLEEVGHRWETVERIVKTDLE